MPKGKQGRTAEVLLNGWGLNPQQELFCKLYASDKEFFGNGVQSYIEAYEPDRTKPNWYKTVMATASVLLRNPKVCKRITDLLELNELNDNAVDKQLAFVIHQYQDLPSKTRAIAEYNKLKKRVEGMQETRVMIVMDTQLSNPSIYGSQQNPKPQIGTTTKEVTETTIDEGDCFVRI